MSLNIERLESLNVDSKIIDYFDENKINGKIYQQTNEGRMMFK